MGGSGLPVTGALVCSGGHSLSPLPGLFFPFAPLAGIVWWLWEVCELQIPLLAMLPEMFV